MKRLLLTFCVLSLAACVNQTKTAESVFDDKNWDLVSLNKSDVNGDKQNDDIYYLKSKQKLGYSGVSGDEPDSYLAKILIIDSSQKKYELTSNEGFYYEKEK